MTPAGGGGGNGGGGRRRRTAARLAFASVLVLVLVVVAALALLEVGVGLRWSGNAGAGGLLSSHKESSDKDAVDTDDVDDPRAVRDADDDAVDGGKWGVRPAREFRRAYAVVFPDVHDPLVLERAFQLRNSLEAMKGDAEEVVAIVPRFSGRQLVASLKGAGYRVLQRETPAPPWRASGRFTQQAITAIGTGWESGDAGGILEDGGGGGGGHGWGLLALEALSLTEYEEVVVLDQKVVIFQGAHDTQAALSEGSSGGSGEGEEPEGRERITGGSRKRRRTLLSGEGGSEAEMGEKQAGSDGLSMAEKTLPSLVPEGEQWTVAFAPGDGSGLATGPGLSSLSEAYRDLFIGQHAALLAVRPDAELYARISGLLCEGDAAFSEAYPGIPDKDFNQRLARDRLLERRAATIPLLHLAVASTASRNYTAQVPLEVCGGLGEAVDANQGEEGREWRWTGAASPIVWCPSQNFRQQPDQTRRRRRLQTPRFGRNTFGGDGVNLVTRAASIFASSPPQRSAGDDGAVQAKALDLSQTVEPGIDRKGSRAGRRKAGGGESVTRGDVAAASEVAKGGNDARRRRGGAGRVLSRPRGKRDASDSGKRGRVEWGGSGGHGKVSGGVYGLPARRTQEEDGVFDEQDGGGEVGVGQGEGEGEGKKEGVPAGMGMQEDEKTEEDRQEERRESPQIDGGVGGTGVRTVKLAWIPGDPCSCVDAPGLVGEACRGWLVARAADLFSRDDAEKAPAAAEALRTGQAAQDDLRILALSGCKDGALVSPSQLPAPSALQAALASATAGAAHLAQRLSDVGGEPGGGGGNTGGTLSSLPPPPPPPPPLWQDAKPEEKAVVTQLDLRNFQHFWLANVEKKVLMVAIPKVACTQVHALFLRLQGSKNWNSPHMQEIHYHKDMDRYKMSAMAGMTPEKASAILNDPTWTKGVFLRDPAERLLSCFLDKIVHRKSYSVSIFGANDFLSFEKFVALTSKGAEKRFHSQYPGGNLGLSRRSNPHWRPQLYFGLDKFLPYFDFVGDFKHVGAHSEAFLKRAGLWEEFGKSGWGPSGGASFFQRTTVQGHATGSRDSKGQYYTPPLLSSVREAYASTDYRMLAGLGWWNETMIAIVRPATTSASSHR
ncbi:unnamed protein product [Scytosiphon promiscuus]